MCIKKSMSNIYHLIDRSKELLTSHPSPNGRFEETRTRWYQLLQTYEQIDEELTRLTQQCAAIKTYISDHSKPTKRSPVQQKQSLKPSTTWTMVKLREYAKSHGIRGYSKLNKADLLSLLLV